MNSHLAALTSLYPLDLDQGQAILLAVDATFLDAVMTEIQKVEQDIFPETTSKLVAMEQSLGLDSRGTIAERRQRVIARRAMVGGLNRSFFRDLATLLGYDISYVDNPTPFRMGYSAVGDKVWSLDGLGSPWIWTVSINSVGVNTDDKVLKDIFTDLKPANTEINWVYAATIDEGDGLLAAQVQGIDEGDGEVMVAYPTIDEGDGWSTYV